VAVIAEGPTPEMADARRLLTGTRCRAVRELLGLSQEALPPKSGVHWQTVENFEGGRPGTFPVQSKIRAALEAGGVESRPATSLP